jgi:hypothetical protein
MGHANFALMEFSRKLGMNGGTLDSPGDIVTMDTWEKNNPKCRG